MPRTFLLLHSPLVGPSCWEPVAAVLRDHGHVALVPDLRGAGGDIPAMAELALPNGEQPDGPAVVVAHSGAGVVLPSVAARMATPPEACVFVDAQLPRPGEAADAEFLTFLRDLAPDGGFLPPFGNWWGDAALAELLPDAEQRARFVADCPQVPLSTYEAPAPVVEAWPEIAVGRCSYVRLSAAYETQVRAAADLGWPVRCLSSHHLAPLTDPSGVAAEILASIPVEP